jgi:hypothetical protein
MSTVIMSALDTMKMPNPFIFMEECRRMAEEIEDLARKLDRLTELVLSLGAKDNRMDWYGDGK